MVGLISIGAGCYLSPAHELYRFLPWGVVGLHFGSLQTTFGDMGLVVLLTHVNSFQHMDLELHINQALWEGTLQEYIHKVTLLCQLTGHFS